MFPSHSLLRWLRPCSPLDRGARPGRRARPRQTRCRLLLEGLEHRLTPAVSFVLGSPVPEPPSTMLFPVTRSGDSAPAAQVNYTTLDGSGANGAHAGTDYTATSGTLLFPANQTMEAISVPVLNTAVFQAHLTFGVTLSSPMASAAFAPPQSFPVGGVGGRPYSVAVGDLNGDGKPDLVVTNGDGTVSVLLNTTAPGASVPAFAPQQTFPTGGGFGPDSVVLADVNGDGKPDIITANTSGSVSVLLNTTAPGASIPSFAPQEPFITGTSAALATSLAVADANGDGKPDIITANAASSSVSVLLNTTAPGASVPSFAPQQTFATGAIPGSVAVADINGDGKPDLITASSSAPGLGTLSVLLNTTAPGDTTLSFAPPQTFNIGTTASSLAVGDINGDGNPDLIIGDAVPSVSVLLNTTAAGATVLSFAPPQTFDTGLGFNTVVVADVNSDGKPDLVAAGVLTPGINSSVSVLLNTTEPGASILSFAPQETFATGASGLSLNSLAVADVNGDGTPDLITANVASSSVSVLLNTTPSVEFAAVQAVSVTAITSVTPATAVLGQTFTVSASVSPGLSQPNAPTGTVTFFDGSTPLGVANVGSDGVATLTVLAQHPGTLALTATYSGNGNFLSSQSAATPLPVVEQNTIGVFDPATGIWYLRSSNSPGVPDAGQVAYGAPGWVGVIGDWNGDGVGTVGVFDPSTATWYLRNRNSPGAPDIQPFAYGMAGWLPVVGDWSGSGHSGIGIFDPTTATFYLRNSDSPGAPDFVIHYGGVGWTPVVGDWDGNGTTTIGVVDPNGAWYLRNSNSPGAPSITPFVYGGPGWTPVGGDWNGDGVTTVGVLDHAGRWYLRNENSAGAPDVAPFAYGAGGWQPVAGFWNAPASAALPVAEQAALSSVGPMQAGSVPEQEAALATALPASATPAGLGSNDLGELAALLIGRSSQTDLLDAAFASLS